MLTLLICLFIACLLPYLAKIPVAMFMAKQPGGYDNNYPRTQGTQLTGIGARAYAAHQNSFESLVVFSAAVLAALVTQHLTQTIQYLAVAHIISRTIYHFMYLADMAGLRSLIWGIGYMCSLVIIWLCI
jgi:uncharacterized MAPEG superfamily protein